MTDAYVALGANLADPKQQLIDALLALKAHPDFTLIKVSALYASTPMGPQDQPDYVNAVCQIESRISASETLQQLHAIEDNFGRQRIRHWGERTLDLDLLLFGNERHDSTELMVPHPGLLERNFVLVPLHDIDPDKQLPNQRSVAEHCQMITQQGLHMILSQTELEQLLS